jgi:hypothetical protein
VDRLLASPHCAEKLALEWLDLARFGDSSGYQDDSDRPNHPYRDAVIEAFHANMPFDQFMIESLAGDLLPNATLMQKVRSGFNRLHRHNEEGGSDPKEFRVVYAIDRTNTTAATWMGVTFGCTQCHDHKYDPFSQQEYYQLLAFFNSLRGEVPVSKEPSPPFVTVYADEDRRRLDELDREIAALKEARAREIAPAVARFEQWLADPLAAPAWHPDAVGGAVARGPHRSYLADTALAAGLASPHLAALRGIGSRWPAGCSRPTIPSRPASPSTATGGLSLAPVSSARRRISAPGASCPPIRSWSTGWRSSFARRPTAGGPGTSSGS